MLSNRRCLQLSFSNWWSTSKRKLLW